MYRRWPSKIPLVVDALTQMKPPTPAAVGEDTTTREALLRAMAGFTNPHGAERVL